MVNLVRAWADAGLPADLLVCQAEGPYLGQVPDGVRLVDFGTKRVSFALPSLVRYLRTARPDALLAALDHVNLTALAARALAGGSTRVVVSVHAAVSQVARASRGIKSRLLYGAIRWAYPRADAIVAVSQGVADDLRRAAGLPKDRIQVIPNPIVTPDLIALAREPVFHPWFQGNEVPVILAVGRLEPQKDLLTLLDAFAIVRRSRAVRLVILGAGEQKDLLSRRSKDLGLEGELWLGGFQQNPFAYMSRAGVVVLSSVYEGFGNVLVEAMACGTPVVSTDCESGPSEILGGGRLGLLVPIQNPVALAAAILATLANPPSGAVLREAAAEYSVATAAGRYREILFPNDGRHW